MKFPFISIVIVTYNSKHHLEECLTSLKKTDYPSKKYEVIIVDNNSKDGTDEYVKKVFPWVRFVKLNKNYGVDFANNIGAKKSRGKYVVFLNPDTVVEKDWLKELTKEIESNDRIASVGPKVIYYQKDIINTIGSCWTILGFSFAVGEGEPKEKFSKKRFIFAPAGCCMMVRKDLFLSLGGFDEDYFMYIEEPDLTWKFWNLGYKVLFVPSSIIYHKGGSTVKIKSGFKPMIYYHGTKNTLTTILKNARSCDLVWMVPLHIIFHSIVALLFLFKGKLKNALFILKGIIWPFQNLEKILKKRRNSIHNNRANKMMLGFKDSVKILIQRSHKYLR